MKNLIKPGDFSLILEWMRTKHYYNFTPIPILFEQAKERGREKYEASDKKKKIKRNLRSAFGKEKNKKFFEEIGRRHCEYLELLDLTLLWPKIQGFADAEKVNIRGLENLQKARRAGRGAILLTAHFGYARLIKHLIHMRGIEARLVGPKVEEKRKEQHSLLARYVFEKGLRMPVFSANKENDIEAALNVRPLIKTLKRNEVLVLTADGLRASNLVDVNVLGQKIPCATGSVSLARSSGAAVLPTFVVDDDESEVGIKLVIEPPLPLRKTRDKRADIVVNLQKFGDVFDGYIRAYPHLYRWTKSNFFERRRENSKVDIADRYAGNFKKVRKEKAPEIKTAEV